MHKRVKQQTAGRTYTIHTVRGEEELEAPDVARRRAPAALHVAAPEPHRTRRHADALVADDGRRRVATGQ